MASPPTRRWPDRHPPVPGRNRICSGRSCGALLRASTHDGNLHILIPMLMINGWPGDINQAGQADLADEGIPRNRHVKIGAMIETPPPRRSGWPTSLKLFLDGHQRPDSVHAGGGPQRRRRQHRCTIPPTRRGAVA